MATPEQQVAPPRRPSAADTLAAAGKGTVATGELTAAPTLIATVVQARGIAEATKQIVGALANFAHIRRQTIIPALQSDLVEHFQTRSPDEISKMIGKEQAREREFLRKQAARIARDLPGVLAEADDEKRREAMRKLMSREKRYMAQREKAMTARAHTAVESLDLEEASPEGAFWLLGGPVHKHTPGCLAMANRFWPWPVLRDVISPPVHPGCPCELISLDEAARRGLMNPKHLPDVRDALLRARRNADLEESVTSTFPAWQIEDEMRVLEEAIHHEDHSVRLRFAKGLIKGGQFMPKYGVSAASKPRISGRKLGRSVWIKGHRVHIPEERSFSRAMGGATFTSPAGGTNVYRNGELASTPDLPSLHRDLERPRGPVKRPRVSKRAGVAPEPVVSADQQRKLAAGKQVERALRKASADVSPVRDGEQAQVAHRALRSGGFKHDEGGAKQTDTELTVPYSHRDGHDVSVTFDRQTSKVKASKWSPAPDGSDTTALRSKLGLDQPEAPKPVVEPTPAPTPEETTPTSPTFGTGNPKWARQVARALGGNRDAQWDVAQESIARGPNSEFSRELRVQVGSRRMSAWQRATEWPGVVPNGPAPARYAVVRSEGRDAGPTVGVASHAGPQTGRLGTGHYFTGTPQPDSHGDGVSLLGAHLHRPYDVVASRNLSAGLSMLDAIASGTGDATRAVDPNTGEQRHLTLADALDRMPSSIPRRDAEVFARDSIERQRNGDPESAATHMMRAMGFDGVDNRHLPELDTPLDGSVVYSARGNEVDPKLAQFASALARATTITLAQVQAGGVPGISAEEIRPGVSGHAGLGRQESLRMSPTTAFDKNGRIDTVLLAHEIGHHVAQQINRESGLATGGSFNDLMMPFRRNPANPHVYDNPFGLNPNPEEVLSDAYSNVLHGAIEHAEADRLDADGNPTGEPESNSLKLLRAVAAKAAEMGLPSSQIYRTTVDESKGYDDPDRYGKEYVGPKLPTPLKVENYEGKVGDRNHITRVETGDIPTSAIAHLSGVRGEVPGDHRNRQGEEWAKFLADVQKNGITDPIFITVDPGGTPQISEGNHRRDAAVELGMDHVPVEIKYYGHSEHAGSVVERGGVVASAAQGGAVQNGKVGRWIWIRGRINFVPQDALWEKESDGYKFTSPAGGTNMYRAEPNDVGIGTLVNEPGKRGYHPDVINPNTGGTERGAIRPRQARVTEVAPGDEPVEPEPDVIPEPPALPEGIGLALSPEARDSLLAGGTEGEGIAFVPSQREPVNATGLVEGHLTLGPVWQRMTPEERQYALDSAFGQALAAAIGEDDGGRDDLGKLWTSGKFERDFQGQHVYLDRYSAENGIATAYARMGGEDWRDFAAQYPDVALFAADQAYGRGYFLRPDVHAWLNEEDNAAPPVQELNDEAKALASDLVGLTDAQARRRLIDGGYVQHTNAYVRDSHTWRKVDEATQSVQTMLLKAERDAEPSGQGEFRDLRIASVEGTSYSFDPNQEPPEGDTPERLAYEMRGLEPNAMVARMRAAGYVTMEARFNEGDMENVFVRPHSDIAILVRTPNGYQTPVTDARPTMLTSLEQEARLIAIARHDPTVIPVGTTREDLGPIAAGSGWGMRRAASGSYVDLVRSDNERDSETATIDIWRVLIDGGGRVTAVGRPNATSGLARDDAEWQSIHAEMQDELRAQITERNQRIDALEETIRSSINVGQTPDVKDYARNDVEEALIGLGYRDQATSRTLQNGQQSDTWENRTTGARLTLRSKQLPRDENGYVRTVVVSVRVIKPGDPDFGRVRPPEGQMPTSMAEMKADIFGLSDEIAEKMGAESDLVRLEFAGRYAKPPDHNGYHRTDGLIMYGNQVEPDLLTLMAARAEGRELTDYEKVQAITMYKLLAHEVLHAVHAPNQQRLSDPVSGALGLEEWLTEDLAQQTALEWMARHGHHDAIDFWRTRADEIYEVYPIHRSNGYQLLREMGLGEGDVSNDELRQVMEDWKFRKTEKSRREDIKARLQAHSGMTPADADDHITAVMGMRNKDEGVGPVEGFRQRLSLDFPEPPLPPLGVGSTVKITTTDEDNGKVGEVLSDEGGYNAQGQAVVRYLVRISATGQVHTFSGDALTAIQPVRTRWNPTEALSDGSTIRVGAMVAGVNPGGPWEVVGLTREYGTRNIPMMMIRASDGSITPLPAEGARGIAITDAGMQLRVGDRAFDPITETEGRVSQIDWSDPEVPRVTLTWSVDGKRIESTLTQMKFLEPRSGEPWDHTRWKLGLADRQGRPRMATAGDKVVLSSGEPVRLMDARLEHWPRGSTRYTVQREDGRLAQVFADGIKGFQDELPVTPVLSDNPNIRRATRALLADHYAGDGHFTNDPAHAMVQAEVLGEALGREVGDRFKIWAKANAVPFPVRGDGRERSGPEVIQDIYRGAFLSRAEMHRQEEEHPGLYSAVMTLAEEAGLPTPDWSQTRDPSAMPVPAGPITDEAVARAVFSGTFGRGGLSASVRETTTNEAATVVHVEGYVYNEAGNRVGEFQRSVTKGSDGVWRAHHSEMKLDREAQGTGFATAFNNHVFEQYARLGVQEVLTQADIDVGGYTWAATGFDFAIPSDGRTWSDRERAEWRAKQVEIMVTNAHSGGDISDEELNSISDRVWTWWGVNEGEFDPDKHIHHAWDLAHIDGRNGSPPGEPYTLGQKILIGSDWSAIKLIEPADTGALYSEREAAPLPDYMVADWVEGPGASKSLQRTMRDFAGAVQDLHPGVQPLSPPTVRVGDLRWRDADNPPRATYGRDSSEIMLGNDMAVKDREFYLAHEYAHHLDNTIVRAAIDPETGYAQPEWNALMHAVQESPMPSDVFSALGRGTVTEKLAEYMLSREEVFARAYTRWIGIRSGNERILATQHRIENEEYGEWTDETFEPIAAAMDDLFERLDMMPVESRRAPDAVDESRPLSLYHGTSKPGAQAIKAGGFRPGGGITFATSHEPTARDYAGEGGVVMPVTANLQNPLVLQPGDSLAHALRGLGIANPSPTYESEREQAAALTSAGYDGIVQRLAEDTTDPSDPYPARVIARIADPSTLTVGHFAERPATPVAVPPRAGGPPVENGRWTRMEDYAKAQGEPFTRANMDARDRWQRAVTYAVGMGTLTPEEAKRLGASSIDAREPDKIVPLPPRMWHATTALTPVRESGLKSRFELGQSSGLGLGGGSDNTISFTTSPEDAQHVARQLELVRSVVAGDRSIDQLVAAARAGEGAQHPYDAGFEAKTHLTQQRARGIPEERIVSGGAQPTQQVWDDGWLPDLSTQFVGPDGEPAWTRFTRPVSEYRQAEARAAVAIEFVKARSEAGGEGYVFFAGDLAGLGRVPASEIGVVAVESNPGAHGYVVQGETVPEYRALTGDSVAIVGSEPVRPS